MGLRLLLVRHGETDWNVTRRWQGQSGPGLNPLGRAQARAVADHLAVHEPDARLISSDLARALETAERISEAVSAEIATDARLREIDVGRWTGMTHEQVSAESDGGPSGWLGDPAEAFGTTGESVEDLRRRVGEWLAAPPLDDDTTVVAVTHGGVVRAAVAEVLGMDDLEPLRGCANASVTELRWSESRDRWRLAAYNDTAHLRHLADSQDTDIPRPGAPAGRADTEPGDLELADVERSA